MEFIDIAVWGAGAVIVVGLLEWVKGMLPKAPTWAWAIAAPIASIITAFASKSDMLIWNALGILAISQMCYQLVIQSIKKKFTPKE